MYYDYFKSWNNTKKQVMPAEGQSSLQSDLCHVIYINETH